ncbi:RagB/SusD family nutrient uptake outer membrane protein [Sphingobacterium corticibacter]|uniref:RagB/SusD family nutrient uptake outer membrane protein n=1 Tax=Sphingobacterium corticibacter TaxID=2171749 RepID=A0A2T8HIG1_9SPHI|nr:RagB/SusD family nutrient uptake outer membrane protein [Sphingobacterium corticibacter]PVH25224.1 RagB/SusD family nutrient uptake outer membrane protein [Sphingobacterium corticibacter]
MQLKIKNNLKKYITGIAITTTLLQACKSESGLYPVPETTISDRNVFDTPARIEGLVNGIYRNLKAASLYGGRYLMYQDVRGEDFINVTLNSFTGFDSWNNSYSSGSNDINNLWSAAYTTINSANIVIQGLENTTVISEAAAAAYVGEAKFLRALSYFSLITVFAQPYALDQGASPGIPLRLQAETSTANNALARSTVAEVYAQIIQDLNDAESALPDNYTTAMLNTTRAHKNTATALKTRVYLTTGNFPKVIEEAAKIVPQTTAPFSAQRGVAHALQSDIQVLFSSNYTTTESILSMPMTPTDALSGQSAIGFVYLVNREYYLNPTGILGSAQWSATDVRRNLLQTTAGRQYLRKYAKASPFVDYIPVIRYAEVLLNYAEAAAEGGQLDLASSLLLAVHRRSDPSFTLAADIANDKSRLLTAIAHERRIELLGEGFGGQDLLRKLQALPAKGDANIQTPRVEPSAQNYIFPPPNTEIATNPLFR